MVMIFIPIYHPMKHSAQTDWILGALTSSCAHCQIVMQYLFHATLHNVVNHDTHNIQLVDVMNAQFAIIIIY